jgi:hypothetical protein
MTELSKNAETQQSCETAVMPCLNYSLDDIKGEIWTDVIGYDGYYLISNFGRIKSLPRIMFTSKGVECMTKEKIKRVRLINEKTGRTNIFCELSLNSINKRFNLSKLVALHFIKNYNDETLYFIDGNRNNCCLSNLILVTNDNVISLYDNNIIIPPNEVSEMLHSMGYKKCSVCKKIKLINFFSKSNRNRNVNNNCQICINQLVYSWRNK